MKSVKFGTIGMLVGGAALLVPGAAFAQEPVAAATTTTTTTTTPVATPAPASAPAPAQAGMALPGAVPDAAAGTRDHDGVVGHFGVGYMGRRSMVIDPNAAAVDAPIIGARYWLDPMIGIDVGLGLLFNGGSSTTAGVSTDSRGFSIFMLHGGVPLALAGSKHFSFQIVPELNFGYGSSGRGAGMGNDLSAIHFDIGARAGTEIQFGFIGIPELSLQAGIGLAFSIDHQTATPVMGNATTTSQSSLGTSVGDNPWNIFTGNIAALYYFD